MSASTLAVLALGLLVADVNGANDVSKGIATLVGSGVSDYRRAIRWGALWTAAGGLAGASLAGAMLGTFGNGLFAPGATPAFSAALATILGAADCLCAEAEPAMTAVAVAADARPHASALEPMGARLRFTVAPSEACPSAETATLRLTLDHLHWLTSGATSSARGLNDGPRLVALVLAAAALSGDAGALSPALAFAAVTLGMVAGSLAGGRRVTHVLAENVTRMDHREGFGANLVTSLVVAAGAVGGLPMSTTHVSSTAIVGIGTERGAGALNWKTVREMALAWIVTLPASALLGALGVWVLG